MALFPKKGAPVNIAETWKADIAQYDIDIASLRQKPETNQKRIDELALQADQGDGVALAEIAMLEREIDEAQKLIRRKEQARRQLQSLLETELSAEQSRIDKHLRKKMHARALVREAIIKDIDRHAHGLVRSYAALMAHNAAMHDAWRETWPFKGEALTYPGRVNEIFGHHLYTICKAQNVRLPKIEYSQSDWPGLRERFAASNDWIKQTLMSETVPVPLVADVAPEPAPAPVVTAPTMILSGAAWQELQDASERGREKVARDTEFDPFDASQI